MRNIEEQCTTLEQSKKLAELGFTEESASVRIVHLLRNDWVVVTDNFVCYDEEYPCWTIADMMKILSDARGFDLDVLGKIGIYSADEPCKVIVGKDITVRDNYSILRDNFFEALVALKDYKNL